MPVILRGSLLLLFICPQGGRVVRQAPIPAGCAQNPCDPEAPIGLTKGLRRATTDQPQAVGAAAAERWQMQVARFEGAGADVTLEARWRILGGDTGR